MTVMRYGVWPENLVQDYGSRATAAREKRGLSVEMVAQEAAGLSVTDIEGIEAGDPKRRISELLALLDAYEALGIPLSEVFS